MPLSPQLNCPHHTAIPCPGPFSLHSTRHNRSQPRAASLPVRHLLSATGTSAPRERDLPGLFAVTPGLAHRSAQYTRVEWIRDYVNAENTRRVLWKTDTAGLLWPFLNKVTGVCRQITVGPAQFLCQFLMGGCFVRTDKCTEQIHLQTTPQA